MITVTELSTALQIPLARAQKWVAAINKAMDRYAINTPLRIAHFLAQLGHESGRFVYVREIASGRAYNGRVDLGNMKAEALAIAKRNGSTAGEWWKGHGLIQVTGYDNHLQCGADLKLDLLNNPTLLELPDHAAMSAGWFWDKNKLNVLADADQLVKITRKINGGTNGLADRTLIFNKVREVIK